MQDSGYYDLICELLLLTYADLRPGSRKGGQYLKYRLDALAFLESEWFEQLCVAADLDPARVRKRMIS